jgi:protein TonB
MNWLKEAIDPGVIWRPDRHAGRRAGAGGSWMGLGASVLLHVATAAVALFTISAVPPARAPLVIDFTLEGPGGPEPAFAPAQPGKGRRATAPARPESPPAVLPVPAPAAPMPATLPETPPARPMESPPPTALSLPQARPAEVPPPAPSGAAGRAERAASAPGGSAAVTVSVPAGAGSPQGAYPGQPTARAATGGGAGAEEPGEAGTKARGRYLERNYAYIRDAIQQGIAYPAMARRMGWEGKVVVSFLVLSDGSVRDVRVVQGSGHSALDRGAVEAVRKAAPFPKPPAEAEIITPVVYRLD